MRRIEYGTTFKKDYKRMMKRGAPASKLNAVLILLMNNEPLPVRNRPHILSRRRTAEAAQCSVERKPCGQRRPVVQCRAVAEQIPDIRVGKDISRNGESEFTVFVRGLVDKCNGDSGRLIDIALKPSFQRGGIPYRAVGKQHALDARAGIGKPLDVNSIIRAG